MTGSFFSFFGHVPTPEEMNAKAFITPREVQMHPSGFFVGYIAGLCDADAVSDKDAEALIKAAANGQLSHNLEPLFADELDDFENECEKCLGIVLNRNVIGTEEGDDD